jgi:hypothetical protein
MIRFVALDPSTIVVNATPAEAGKFSIGILMRLKAVF